MKKLLAILLFCLSTSNASALTCTLPFNLLNGQLADATQVMANYNALATCFTLVFSNTNIIPIANGGTNANNQQNALNNLMPAPTRAGDLAYYNGTNWVGLAGNNSGANYLQETSLGIPSWVALPTFAGNNTFTGQFIETGTSVPADVANQTIILGTVSVPVLTNNGQAYHYNTVANGAVIQGIGSSTDIIILNKGGSTVCSVATGTTTFTCANLALTNPLPITSGGTGAATAAAAISALMPTPTRAGDIAYWNGSIWTTLAGNNSGTQVFTENSSGVPAWAVAAGTGTVTSVACNGVTITTSGTCPEAFEFKNCSLAASVATNILTVALKDNTGADPTATSPCRIAFRNATANNGTWTIDTVTAANSVNTNATGATLGTVNNTAFRFWVVAFENSGSVVLSLYNASTATSCKSIDETQVQSSTPFSGTATAAQTYYTPNGTTITNKPIKIIGFVEYNSTGLATVGTYATAPNFINTFSKGMKKPCDPIQTVYKTDTAQGLIQAGSTTKVECTGMNATITPSSAANPIIIRQYIPWVQTNTNAAQALVQMGRNSSSNMIGNSGVGGYNGLASSNGISAVTIMAWDIPNATSSTVYRVFVFGTGAATNAFQCDDGTNVVFSSEVTEIMG